MCIRDRDRQEDQAGGPGGRQALVDKILQEQLYRRLPSRFSGSVHWQLYYAISPTEGVTHESPLSRDLSKDQKIVAYPMALALSIAMLILSLVVPSELSTFIMISLLFWAAMAGLTSMVILRNGPDYVDQPHLVHVPPRLRN